ncbi:hypothetical protein [Streptomyces sp. NPDC020965]|uniref:hypothetical protein n=1 Tax=Streptomyces sp. NPDC020965 TaxID=3365105 RepID=UPI00379A78DE
MRADTKGLKVSLVASAAALALAATTAPALAADEPTAPSVHIGAAVTEKLQRGSFSVFAASDTPRATITAVSATVRQGDTVVADIPALTPGTNPERFAVPADALLKLTEDGGTIPALGRYTVDVTATDSTGATATRRNAGTLDFTLRPALTLDASQPSWQDRNARPQGRLIGIQPGSGDEVALPGRTVDVSRTDIADGATHPVTTTANGDFTAPAFPLTAPKGTFRAEFAESGKEVNGTATRDSSVSEFEARPMTLTATADRTRVLPGEQATITGRAMYGTEPAANTTVRVRLTRAGVESAFGATAVTGTDGRFTVRVAAMSHYRMDAWEAVPADPYTGGSAGAPLAHPSDITLAMTKAYLAADGQLKVSGTLRRVLESGVLPYGSPTIVVERSENGKTGWKQAGSGVARGSEIRNLTGKAVSGGHFRLRHPVSDTYTEAVSPVFPLNRAETRIASVNAGPEPVKKGGTLTVTGIAGERAGTKWKALDDTSVQLWFRATDSTVWSRVAYDTTDSAGRASFKVKATKAGTWNIRYYGNPTRMNAVGTGDHVKVG